jgi:hypothetical protein
VREWEEVREMILILIGGGRARVGRSKRGDIDIDARVGRSKRGDIHIDSYTTRLKWQGIKIHYCGRKNDHEPRIVYHCQSHNDWC